MKLENPQSPRQIAELIGARLVNEQLDNKVTGINEIHKVEPGDLMFVDHPKYYGKALQSDATFILINKEVECPADKCLLIHPEPFKAYNFLVENFYPVHDSFPVGLNDSTQEIDPTAIIHRGVVLGKNVKIGAATIIYPNVVIYDNVTIGERVIIHANAVIGGQAFYYSGKNGQFTKWHSCGSVVIEDEVEIGAACTIDKGVSGATRIGRGTKFDNHVHVGHGVVIGKNCLFAAQVGIGGKAIIEDEVICWGQVGITKDVRIGKKAVIAAQAGVSKSLKGGMTYFGSPAREMKLALKDLANLRSRK